MTQEEIYWGAGVTSIVFLEVYPLVSRKYSQEGRPQLSNVFVKHFLQRQTKNQIIGRGREERRGSIEVEWESTSGNVELSEGKETLPKSRSSTRRDLRAGYLSEVESKRRVNFDVENGQQHSVPVIFLPSNNPAELDPFPCVVKAYGSPIRDESNGFSKHVLISSSTLVRVLPPRIPSLVSLPMDRYILDAHQKLLGEVGDDFLEPSLQEEVLANHDPETIRALSLRMSMQCSRGIYIGTTADALKAHQQQSSRSRRMQEAIRARLGVPSQPFTGTKNRSSRSLPWEPSIIVHSPNHADGKTLLVQAIAKCVGCAYIHILRCGPLLAMYGIHADTAFESIMHGILVSAAVRGKPVCVILDHLDTMMPPQLSGRSGAGDSALPVFNAIASYLGKISTTMERSQAFPFPIKNTLYNAGTSNGMVLSVNLCLVGIVTCPDDGWRSRQNGMAASSTIGATILDSLQGGRFRLPSLSSETRWKAFSKAIEAANIRLDDLAHKRLPVLAASAAWAKGSAFRRLAGILMAHESARETETICKKDLERAFAIVQSNSTDFANVTFQSATTDEGADGEERFASVGGNLQAKKALEDALALEPKKRQLLARFGMSPPTGILLYGPPGNGKTLLAKAVARLLKAPAASDSILPTGGTFISLGSSDLVRAEIGTSEKLLVSTFDFADKNAPSVIFLDEFQALFTERSRGGSGKLATTLLQCMDDIKRWSSVDDVSSDDSSAPSSTSTPNIANRVVVLGATNTPWMIDSAFLRSGRFDRVVHVGLPSRSERASILKVHISRMKIQDKAITATVDCLCQSMAKQTDGFSGADLAALCRAAAIRALSDGREEIWVDDRHFAMALDTDVRASSDARLVQRLLRWKP